MATQRVDRIRFLVCPGWVISKNDHQWHWITAEQLIRLYVLRREECLIENESTHLHVVGRRFDTRNLIRIAPRYAGDYPAFARNLR